MRRLLIAAAASIAALTALATPAAAQGTSAQGFSAGNGSTIRFVDGDPRNDPRRRRGGDLFIGEWPQQGDTAWRPGSYNDWWHEQPERSYPAWMRRNQGCQRLWWSGGGWTC